MINLTTSLKFSSLSHAPARSGTQRLREESSKLQAMAIRAKVPAIVLAPVADFVVKKIFHLKHHDIFLWRFYGSLAKAGY